MFEFFRMDLNQIDWKFFQEIDENNVFQSPEWINFLIRKQNIEPAIIKIEKNGELQGYFVGLIVEKFGLRILGSPFRGWTTYFMGFNLMPGVSRKDILKTFPEFVFDQLGCQYIEVVDPIMQEQDFSGLPFKSERLPWYVLDLTKSEAELFDNMKHACRTNIRKALKSGVAIKQIKDPSFAEEYYAQYTDVMKRHSLSPAFKFESVQLMLEYMLPSNNLLLLRAENADGVGIATGIFLAANRTGIFWGAASWQQFQCLRPNEFLAWQGIKMLKAQGVQEFHFGGYAEQYKEKFGCQNAEVFRLRLAGNSVLGKLIDFAASPTSERYRNWIIQQL